MKLSNLFKNPKPWILDIELKCNYSSSIIGLNNKYYYLYAWVNIDENSTTYQWCYLGLHSSDNPNNEENYLGSCGNMHYWNSRKFHEYKFIILDYFQTEEDLLLAEKELISSEMILKYSENGLFNLKEGGHSFSKSAREASHSLETVRKFIESNKLNHGGKLAWNTVEASVIQNQQKLINSIKKRIELINEPDISPKAYYYATELDHHDREIQRHIESICNRMYDNPSILVHPSWNPDWTDLFKWFDDEDNWNLVISKKW